MSTLASLRPFLALLVGPELRRPMLAGLVLASLTVLAGIGLLGLAGWLVTAAGIAGLAAGTAIVFDVFQPSAGIRFLALLRTFSRYGERLVTHDAALRALAGLRLRLLAGWAQPSAARSLLARPARLLFRLTEDVEALDSLYLRILIPAGAMAAASLAACLTLGLVSPLLGLALATWLLLAGLGLTLLGGIAAARPATRRALALERLRGRTVDLIAGQSELALTGRLQAQQARVAAADARLAQSDAALQRIDTGVAAGLSLAGGLALAGTLLAGAHLVEAGTTSAPVIAGLVLVALAAVEPFAGLRRGAMELGRTLLAARRLAPRMASEPPATSLPLPQAGLAFALTGLSAGHTGGAPVLHDVNLWLAAGERLGIVGVSGAGKSSLLAVLAGEMAARTGAVQTLPATLLTQRTELFRDSLRQNLRLAAAHADDAALLQAIEDAGLGADFAGWPRGLDTMLGDGGQGLSSGQSRRLALARLFLRDQPLWLLDEPTEGLDAATAADVLARLDARADGRSLVVVTHTAREAALVDRLIVINGGRITASHRRGEQGFTAITEQLRPDR